MAGVRHKGRSCALQMLYQSELNQQPHSEGLAWLFEEEGIPKRARGFAVELLEATREHQPEIDRQLSDVLEHWKLGRLSVVVRNLLRLAVCEMLYLRETPFQVVINEAVELTREFMDEESARFVNSVLEKCWHAAPEPPASPASGAS